MITMYGGPPVFDPLQPVTPGTAKPIDWGQYRVAAPVDPATKVAPPGIEDMRVQVQARAAWLRNELRMHAAWKLELAALERVLAAMPIRVGDVVRSHKAPDIIGTVVKSIQGDEGEKIFARWDPESDTDTWIHIRDVELMPRPAELPSDTKGSP